MISLHLDPLREAVARIIDPATWAMLDEAAVVNKRPVFWDETSARSLATADRIIALLAAKPVTDVMVRAYYEAKHTPRGAPAGGFTRWATFEEACAVPGWLEDTRRHLEAALKAKEPTDG